MHCIEEGILVVPDFKSLTGSQTKYPEAAALELEGSVLEEAPPEPEEKHREKVTLPLFESSVVSSAGPSTETRVMVQLARLHIEAQDRAQIRQAELELRILERAKEQAIHLRRLELDAELKLRQLNCGVNCHSPKERKPQSM